MHYTKGKWVKQGLLVATVSQPQGIGVIVADCRTSSNLNEVEANAHLIASAPDMYEALGIIKRTTESSGESIHYLQNALRVITHIAKEALAKAEGK